MFLKLIRLKKQTFPLGTGLNNTNFSVGRLSVMVTTYRKTQIMLLFSMYL